MSLLFIISVIIINLTNSATFSCDAQICSFGVCTQQACRDNTYICSNPSSTCSLQCNSGCQKITLISNAQNTQLTCAQRNSCQDISISITDINGHLTVDCRKNGACSAINIQCANANNCLCQEWCTNVNVDWTPTTTTSQPTQFPTKIPTSNPTTFPSLNPTTISTVTSSKNPTAVPSQFPSKTPTYFPTLNPSQIPSYTPTKLPTIYPSVSPTSNPSYTTTNIATLNPSQFPTKLPTTDPSYTPTLIPTKLPTIYPNVLPTKYSVENTQIVTVILGESKTESTTINIATKHEIIYVHMNNSEPTNTHLISILIVVGLCILFIGICIAIPIYVSKYKKQKLIKKSFEDKEHSNDIEMMTTKPKDDSDFWVNPLYKHTRKEAVDVTNNLGKEFVIKSDSEQSETEYKFGESKLTLPASMVNAAMVKDLPRSPNSNDEGMIMASIGSPSCGDIGSILYEPGIDQVTPGGEFHE